MHRVDHMSKSAQAIVRFRDSDCDDASNRLVRCRVVRRLTAGAVRCGTARMPEPMLVPTTSAAAPTTLPRFAPPPEDGASATPAATSPSPEAAAARRRARSRRSHLGDGPGPLAGGCTTAAPLDAAAAMDSPFRQACRGRHWDAPVRGAVESSWAVLQAGARDGALHRGGFLGVCELELRTGGNPHGGIFIVGVTECVVECRPHDHVES